MMPQERKPQIIEEFKRRRTRQLMVVAPVILAAVFLGWIQDHRSVSIAGLSSSALVGLAIAVVVGAVIFSLSNWRCPACNRYLGKVFNPSFCPKCGVQLHG